MTACQYCSRPIVRRNGTWIDPAATGDDSLWRETCEGNDTFPAEHAPATTYGDCPVGDLAGDPHKYPVGTGVVVPWHVAGDPRSGVESCRACYLAAATATEYLRFRGYQNIEEWAADSDYIRTGDTWRDEHGNEIRPLAQLFAALEREQEEYQ